MRRATVEDASAVADLLNDPRIRPTIGGEGELDPTTFLQNVRNICLFSDDGGAMFLWTGEREYQGHSFFKVRGREALKQGRGILALMFGLYGAKRIHGETPLDNKAARWFNRQLGFQSLGEIDTPDSGRCELFVLEKH